MASLNFSKTLKELRLKAGYTQKQVYEHFDIPQSTFSSWEVGKSEPSGEMLLKLCDFYDCEVMKVFNDDILSNNELQIIEKYRALDNRGKKIVDFILGEEWERSTEPKNKDATRLIQYYYLLASAGTGQLIFDNPPSELIEIPNIPKYKSVNYAIGVNGDSMKPLFNHEDILLIEVTNSINVGDVGIFIVDGESYVKKLGESELISLNKKYPNIPLDENARCLGKVIDTLK